MQCTNFGLLVDTGLDDQTQVDSKPAGQPEHANLNQCQLIAANRLKLVLWAPPAGVEISHHKVGRTSDFLNNGIYYRVIHHIEAKTERNALASRKTKKIQHVCQKLTFHLFQQDFQSAKIHPMAKIA